jgi:uncharacterized membrane protein YdjX (TVP38/TMEM64 family)
MKPWLRWTLLACLVLALILVPFALWEEPINIWVARLLTPAAGRVTLALLFILLLTSDVLLPIPSSFVSAAAVSLLGAAQGSVTIVVGMTGAAWLGYALGRFGGEPLTRRLAGEQELARARTLWQLGAAGVSRRTGRRRGVDLACWDDALVDLALRPRDQPR